MSEKPDSFYQCIVLVHSQANHLRFYIITNTLGTNICIEDDGVGYDRETINRISGLENMQKRAENIALLLSQKSEIGLGTKVTLTI